MCRLLSRRCPLVVAQRVADNAPFISRDRGNDSDYALGNLHEKKFSPVSAKLDGISFVSAKASQRDRAKKYRGALADFLWTQRCRLAIVSHWWFRKFSSRNVRRGECARLSGIYFRIISPE